LVPIANTPYTEFIFIVKARSLNAAKALHLAYDYNIDGELTAACVDCNMEIIINKEQAYMEYQAFITDPDTKYIQGPYISRNLNDPL
jgi:hypothetical protein